MPNVCRKNNLVRVLQEQMRCLRLIQLSRSEIHEPHYEVMGNNRDMHEEMSLHIRETI